jgi:hypothetical protein
MSGLTLRALAVLAAGALVLAFIASLVLVSSQNASSVSTRPLVVYGSRGPGGGVRAAAGRSGPGRPACRRASDGGPARGRLLRHLR